MTDVQLHFILYTNQLFPAKCYCNDEGIVHFILYTKQMFPFTCYSNDSCTVTFYTLYKASVPRYMLL